MVINILIKAHAFAEEKLVDELFSQSPHYGIVGPEVMEPLAKWRNQTVVVSYQEDTTVIQIQESIDRIIWGFPSQKLLFHPRFMFEYRDERFEINNPAANFMNLLNKFLDPKQSGSITVCYLVCHDAGRVEPTEGILRYCIHSRESKKHHEPHVHVYDAAKNYEASIRIADGKILAGDLPKRMARIAQDVILNNQEYY